MLFTYADAIQHVIDAVGSDTSVNERRFARRSIQSALSDLVNAHRFSYFTKIGRIVTSEPYSTGSITYTHSSRTVTLAVGIFPSWTAYGVLLIDNVPYEIASVTDSTHVILKSNTNPGADLASGTAYTLYRDAYVLPEDFVSIDNLYNVTSNERLEYIPPEDWLIAQRWNRTPARPCEFTITSDPRIQNRRCIRFTESPSSALVFDFIYARRPRALRYENVADGTASVTAASATVTGSGTAFTSGMIGSVIRLSDNGTYAPTGLEGDYPSPDTERIIVAVGSATSLTVNSAITNAATSVLYSITDPIDVDPGELLNYFKSLYVKRAKIERNAHDAEVAIAHCSQELVIAMGADNPYHGYGVAGEGRGRGSGVSLADLRTDA